MANNYGGWKGRVAHGTMAHISRYRQKPYITTNAYHYFDRYGTSDQVYQLSHVHTKSPSTGAMAYSGRRRRQYRRRRKVSNYSRMKRFYSKPNELKHHDITADDAVVASTGFINASLNLIAQNVTQTGRIGRRCNLTSINWRWTATLPAHADSADIPNGDVLRIILFIDKQCNGTGPVVADFLQDATDFQSFRKLSNTIRFRVLTDKFVHLNRMVSQTDGTNTSAGPKITIAGAYYKKLNLPLIFDGTAGALTEIDSNNLTLLLISQHGLCGFESHFRLRFYG